MTVSACFLASSTVRSELNESTTRTSSAHRTLRRHRSMFFSSLNVMTTTESLSMPLSGHQADELVLYDHRFDDCPALQVPLNVRVSVDQLLESLLAGIDRRPELRPDFSVDLDDDLHRIDRNFRFVERRPGLVRQGVPVPELLPELFRQMRGERGKEENEGLHRRAGLRIGVQELVHKNHHLGNRRVEVQPFDIPRHLFDGLVKKPLLR